MLCGGTPGDPVPLGNANSRLVSLVWFALGACINTRIRNRVAVRTSLALPLCFFMMGQAAWAVDVAVQKDDQDPCEEAAIEGYEPNTFGYTKQANDEGFADFTISIKSLLFRDGICRRTGGTNRLYFTFTGRFGFYIRTRHSSPVIAKNYNPKMVWRVIPDTSDTTPVTVHGNKAAREYTSYVEFAYAHDSNGQSIDTLQEFEVEASQIGSAADAQDHVSRGWDYLQATGKKSFSGGHWGSAVLSVYPDLKFFLRHGLLQGAPEEYYRWEQDSALRPRHAFDGISAAVEYRPFAGRGGEDAGKAVPLSSLRMELKYTTGYEPVARYNTVLGELGVNVFGLPVTLWAKDGYMNGLARYYKKTRALGMELRFAEF